jgi:hypothetical protein
MGIFLGILEFIFAIIAIFFSWVLVMLIVNMVVNPEIKVENGKVVEKHSNARLMYALIIAIAWAFVIIIS